MIFADQFCAIAVSAIRNVTCGDAQLLSCPVGEETVLWLRNGEEINATHSLTSTASVVLLEPATPSLNGTTLECFILSGDGPTFVKNWSIVIKGETLVL